MPIEFRCSNCQRLLRTPDESAGRKAKCPECATVVDVPNGSAPLPTATPAAAAAPSAPAAKRDLFADFAPPAREGGTDYAAANPYASAPVKALAPLGEPFGAAELRHSPATFSDTWEISWDRFSNNLGPFLLAGLVYFGMMFGIGVAATIAFLIGAAVLTPAAERMSDGEAALLIGILMVVAVIIISIPIIWISAGMIKLTAMAARGHEPDVRLLFRASLGASLKMFAITLIVTAISLAIGGVPAGIFAGAGYAVGQEEGAVFGAIAGGVLGLLLTIPIYAATCIATYLAVDRGEGVISSMMLSWQYMKGSMAPAFLILLVTNVLSSILGQVTCNLSLIATVPYLFLVQAVIYCLATGQIAGSSHAESRRGEGFAPPGTNANPFA